MVLSLSDWDFCFGCSRDNSHNNCSRLSCLVGDVGLIDRWLLSKVQCITVAFAICKLVYLHWKTAMLLAPFGRLCNTLLGIELSNAIK